MDRVGAGSTAAGAFWGGIMMSAYAAAMFLCGPIIGSLSDAYGRRPILIAALVTLTIDYVIMAMAETYWVLLVSPGAGRYGRRHIHHRDRLHRRHCRAGGTRCEFRNDRSCLRHRVRSGSGYRRYRIGTGTSPHPSGLRRHSQRSMWLSRFFILPESLKPENRRPFGKRDLNPFGTIIRAFVVPGLAIPLICIFVFEFANMVYPTLWAFWGREVFGWDGFTIGLTLSAYGILIAVVQAGLLPQLTKRFGDYSTLLLAITASTIALVGFGFTRCDLGGCRVPAHFGLVGHGTAFVDSICSQSGGRRPAGFGTRASSPRCHRFPRLPLRWC